MKIILHFIRGHSFIKKLILLPMLAEHLHKIFCTESAEYAEFCLGKWLKFTQKLYGKDRSYIKVCKKTIILTFAE